jgi:hypothetical protein
MVAVGESYTGSYNDPIQLSTPAQFNEIKDDASLTNKNYKLVADLDFGNGTLESIGSASVPFSGVFMGNNHVIKNAYITDASASAPLGIFRKIGYSSIFGTGKIIDFDQDSKTLKYLYLENIDVNHTGADGNTGVLAGEITDYATSSNHQEHDAVIIIGVIDLGGSTVNGAGATSSLGGLIGRANIMNGNSKLSYLDSKVSINHGGIANGVGGTVGSVSVALVAGHSRTPEFKNLIFDGNITANSTSSVGGIFGIISGQVSARIMRSTGDVSGNNYVGGIAGYWAGETIEDSFSRDNIISGANYVGGVVGKLIGSAGQIFGTYAESSVSASSNYAGCLVGQVFNTPTIDNSYANCKNVTSSGTRHFFVNGNVAGASSNLFTTDESASMTNHANATKTNTAQLIDSSSSYANILTAGDPWFWQDGDLPRPWFEVFPEFLIYEN